MSDVYHACGESGDRRRSLGNEHGYNSFRRTVDGALCSEWLPRARAQSSGEGNVYSPGRHYLVREYGVPSKQRASNGHGKERTGSDRGGRGLPNQAVPPVSAHKLLKEPFAPPSTSYVHQTCVVGLKCREQRREQRARQPLLLFLPHTNIKHLPPGLLFVLDLLLLFHSFIFTLTLTPSTTTCTAIMTSSLDQLKATGTV